MSDIEIKPIKRLKGKVFLKGDKSISHRAVIIGSIANGRSVIKNFLKSEDCLCTMKAFQQLGVSIKFSKSDLIIEGRGLRGLNRPSGEIYLGNSGTSMRLISGVLAGQDFESVLTADESLSKRPMYRIIEPLRLMGAEIKAREERYAPLVIKGGRLKSIKYKTKVASAQVKSAIILAGLYADGITEVEEPAKTRDHTERMLSLFGAKLRLEGFKVIVCSNPHLEGRSITIPGDISSSAFFIVGALLLEGSEIEIEGVLFNRRRMGFIDALSQMGADISIKNRSFNGFEDICDVVVKSKRLKGITINEDMIPSLIDELPILMVAASLASGDTHIKKAGELRVKETDRIISMSSALRKMGIEVFVEGDDILIKGAGALKGAELDSFGDHRTAMSLVIASLCAENASRVKDIDCINTSFPEFFQMLDSIIIKK